MAFWTQEQLLDAAQSFQDKPTRPWVNVTCKQTKTHESYRVCLPGGSFSVEIPQGAQKVKAVTNGYLYATEQITPVQARYRFLRAVYGQLQESGRISREQLNNALECMNRAAAPLLLS